MKKLLRLLLVVISLVTAPSLMAAGSTLEVTSQRVFDDLKEKGVFLGTVNGDLFFGVEESGSPDSVKYANRLYRMKQNGSSYDIVKSELLSTPLRECGFVDYKNGLILVGGTTPKGISAACWLVKDNGNGKTDIQALPTLPIEITDPAVGIVNDQLIVTAGKSNQGLNTQTWKLNMKQKDASWESLSPIPFKNGAQQHSAVQNSGNEDLLYLFGDKVLSYSLKHNQWKDQSANTNQVIDVRGQLPIPMGTHHILFLDPAGKYCTYHTVTGKWSNNGFQADSKENTFVCKWNQDYVMMNNGSLNRISFINNVSFGWLNYGVLVIYLLLMIGVGFYFSKKTSTSEQFFKGGGQIPWWAAGISIFATTLSAITFMAIPAKTYTTNWLYFPMSFSILIVAPIVIRWYLPFFRGLKLTSAYEYLEHRFNLTVRLVSSLLFIIFMVTRIGIVLYLPSVALSTVTGIDLMVCILLMSLVTIVYSTMGGVEAVVWGDVIQGGILVFGALISALYLIIGTGGLGETISIAMSAEKSKMLDFSLDLTQPTFWVIFFGAGIANSLITYTSDQTIVQRYLTTADTAKTKRSIWLNGLISLPILVLFYFIGTALFSFFSVRPDLLPTTMNNAEGIFPYFIMNELPVGVAGLLIAAIFAATMSTLSSNINSASTAITVDFAKRIFPGISDRRQLNIARSSGVMIGVLGTLLAVQLSLMEIKSFFDEFNTFIGLLTSGLGGLFAIGIFLPRVRGYAALTALVASVAILLWLRANSPLNFMLYGLIGIGISMVLALILSYIIPEEPKKLTGLTWNYRNPSVKIEKSLYEKTISNSSSFDYVDNDVCTEQTSDGGRA
ncbi:MAG: sodium:solute symporter [Bacteroidales bacterium]